MFDFLNGLFGGLFSFLGGSFYNLLSILSNIYNGITSFLGSLFIGLWNALSWLLTTLFSPILELIDNILYLFQQIFILVILTLKVVAALFGLLMAFATGIINTFVSFASWSGSTSYYSLASPIDAGFQQFLTIINMTGTNTLPLIFAVFIWLLTAYGIIKIVGSRS